MIKCPECGHPREWHARRINRCITYLGNHLACPCKRSYGSIQPTTWQRIIARLLPRRTP